MPAFKIVICPHGNHKHTPVLHWECWISYPLSPDVVHYGTQLVTSRPLFQVLKDWHNVLSDRNGSTITWKEKMPSLSLYSL